jgi:hypothetical protein
MKMSERSRGGVYEQGEKTSLWIASGADEEIFYGEQGTDKGNIHIYMHLNGFHKLSIGLMMMPMVRGWQKSVYMKEARQAISKIGERSDVVIHIIYVSSSMTKVNVRQNKLAIWF